LFNKEGFCTNADNVYLVTSDESNFLARRVAEHLIATGDEVIVINNANTGPPERIAEAEMMSVPVGSEQMSARLGGLEKRLNVIHCATPHGDERDPIKNAERDYLEQVAFLMFCKQFEAHRLVVCLDAELLFANPFELPVSETDKESPKNLAGVNQLALESHLPLIGLPWISARIATLYGPGQTKGIVPDIFSILTDDEPLELYRPEICTKDFVHVDDAVRGVLNAAQSDRTGIFNFSSGRETHIAAMAKLMRRILASKSPITETVTREFFYQRFCFSPTKAFNALGWQASIPLKAGLERTAAWLRDNALS